MLPIEQQLHLLCRLHKQAVEQLDKQLQQQHLQGQMRVEQMKQMQPQSKVLVEPMVFAEQVQGVHQNRLMVEQSH